MDELDRLYRRLVHNVRATAPELLGRSFEVSQIYQELVPYRTNRRELGFAANDEYELALCQLLSGARTLLSGDADMQAAMRRELESPNPDLAAYRAFATSTVGFVEEQLRDVMLRPTPEYAQPIGPGFNPSPVEQATLAGRPTEQVDTPTDFEAPPPPPPPREPRAAAPPPPPPSPPAAPPPPVETTASRGPANAPRPESPMSAARPNPIRPSTGDACRYCGTTLPDGRSIVFCPGCGHNLTIKHCPACNSELEVGWKFCVTCGREI